MTTWRIFSTAKPSGRVIQSTGRVTRRRHACGLEARPAGPSVKHPVDLVGQLRKQGVQCTSLTDFIDTATPSGRFFLHVMASLAEMKRELTIERTRAGLEVAVSSAATGR